MNTRHILFSLALTLATALHGLSQTSRPVAVSNDGLWRAAPKAPAELVMAPWLRPGKGRPVTLDRAALGKGLATCPKEFTEDARLRPVELSLPMPDGSFARFRVVESPIMEPELAAKFPQIRSYSGQGIDDPTASVRLNTTADGLNALVLSAEGAIHICTCPNPEPGLHASYHGRDVRAPSGELACASESNPIATPPAPVLSEAQASLSFSAAGVGGTEVMLRTYRLAVAAMGEYTAYHGGTVESAMAAIATVVNQVNGIFERDFAIRLVLVASNHLVVYTNAATDPYTPPRDVPSLNTTIALNQSILDAVIGSANYDVGYLFGHGEAAGNSLNGVVCVNGSKAAAASTLPATLVGTDWFVRVTAHELGHLFGANHSYNGVNSLCTTRAAVAAFEPGSGSTLMSYVSVCGAADNLQARTDSYFHSGNIDEVRAYVTTGNGRICGVVVPTGNHAPVVSAGPNSTIPRGTPFTLTATGSDEDGDALTFCWEERDLGPAQPATGPGSADNGSSPLFRSFPPTNNPARVFPKLSDILDNYTTIGERLPATTRTMRFRVTARDNRAGVAGSDMQVTVASSAGPFLVTSPNTSVIWSGTQTVTWNVAGTTNAPIRATNVNILLSTDGGFSFPMVLATNTPNDGSEVVALPDMFSATSRIKVEAAGNIFFDLSNTNFTIVPNTPLFVKAGTSLIAEGCLPADGAVDPGETVTVGFVLQNLGASSTNLAVTLVPGGGVLVPGAPQSVGVVPASGGRVTNLFAFTADPSLPCGGTLLATLQLHDGNADLGAVAFSLSLGKTSYRSNTLANTAPVVITTNFPAAPYPTVINVSNLAGTVSHVTATLSNLTHGFLRDLKIVLVGPQGQSVMLLSDVPLDAVSSFSITFDDLALRPLIAVTQVVSGVYRPTNGRLLQPDILTPPAPAGPYAETLSVFDGTNPNGPWKLFVFDTWPVDGGTIAGGWSLNITTSNTVCCSSIGLALGVSDSPDPAILGSNLTYVITVTNSAAATATGVVLTNVLPQGVAFLAASASQGSCAAADGAVTCALGSLAGGGVATVSLTVLARTPGTFTNLATVSRDDAGPNPVGSTATELTTVVPPPLSISIADASAREGNLGVTPMNFAISLSAPADNFISVSYATSNSTAMAGTDYLTRSGVLTLPPGSTGTNVLVTAGGDTLTEGDETFFVTLFNPTNVNLGAKSQAVGTILNDDGLPGQVDHFAWSAVPSPQFAGLLFPAALSARDANNNLVTGFSGKATLTGLAPSADTVIGVGIGNWTFPMQSGNHDARLQSIYLASEIAPARRITALALDIAVAPGQTLSNWTVRLKHTAQTNYPVNAWEGLGWTTMYQTHLSVTSTGWVTFVFPTPFEYDGTNSLMVDFSFNNASSASPGQCRYRNVTGPNRSIYAQANSTFGDPLAWSGTNQPTASAIVRIPIIRLAANPSLPTAPEAIGTFANGSWSGELLAAAASSELVMRADDGDGHFGVSNPFTVEALADVDGDSLPDPWELRYFGSLTAPDGGPLDDADDDGSSNRDEFLAGTDPTDGASELRVRIAVIGPDVRLTFTAQIGRNYRVERTESLAAPIGWEAVPGAEAITGTGALVQVLDPGATGRPQRFYRVRLN